MLVENQTQDHRYDMYSAYFPDQENNADYIFFIIEPRIHTVNMVWLFL